MDLIGAFIAYKIPMTAMPELSSWFSQFSRSCGSICCNISFFKSRSISILDLLVDIKLGSLIEMSIGAAVGAITFSGSIIAFLKLQGIMSGSPITFKGQHPINALILISIIIITYLLCSTQSSKFILDIIRCFFFNRLFINNSNWWCRYAGGNFYA